MVTVKKALKTAADGANAERTAILAKVRRMVGVQPKNTEVAISGTVLVKWLLQRNERYGAKKGGL